MIVASSWCLYYLNPNFLPHGFIPYIVHKCCYGDDLEAVRKTLCLVVVNACFVKELREMMEIHEVLVTSSDGIQAYPTKCNRYTLGNEMVRYLYGVSYG